MQNIRAKTLTSMANIFEFTKRLDNFNLLTEATTAIRDNLPRIMDLNIDQQRRGKDSFGRSLPKYRSQEYARMKHARNPLAPFGVWDLWLTGDLQDAFIAGVQNGELKLYSEDWKYSDIVKRAPGAFGLTDESKQIVKAEIVKPGIVQAFRNKVLR